MDTIKKILIVDDNAETRKVLNCRLSSVQFSVLEAQDGPSAVALAKQEQPQLILLDVIMPGQDGLQTYDVLRHDPSTKEIPIVFLSGLACNLPPRWMSTGGAENFWVVGKPYQSEQLMQIIRKALGEAK